MYVLYILVLLFFLFQEFHVQQVVRSQNVLYTQNIHYVGFYTHDLTEAKQAFEKSIEGLFHTVKFFTEEELRDNPFSRPMVKEFDSDSPYNPNVQKVGFFRWKPYIILKTLLEIPFGDIVFYKDCNVRKYPGYLVNIEEMPKIIRKHLKDTDMFIAVDEDLNNRLQHFCKREVFEAFDVFNVDSYMNAPLLGACTIVIRKTDTTLKIVSDWLNICMIDDIIDPVTRLPQHDGFRWNTLDQAIFNIILQKYIQEKGFYMPMYVYDQGRVLSMNLQRLHRV